ncbi:hypothetical protein [Bradyrhizobium sp. Rc3b]|uniref:hypothetical protein n=1 Tax=Bradyrhizobium sp. Rc3b TaxID=1855322 RepID=UPI000B891B7B|nr:hypothetical protein [Bradyrhizobium sp. Rc3b]
MPLRSQADERSASGYGFDKKLAALKRSHDDEIDRLKDRLRHFEDRGKRSNEKEYEALSDIWEKFIDTMQVREARWFS